MKNENEKNVQKFEQFKEEQNKYDGLWIIGYGLGGGFGGARNYEVIEAYDEDEAIKMAWEMASEEYESYVGLHGLRTLEEIMEEDGLEEEDALDTYIEEKENWLEYSAKPYTKEYENKVKNYHYDNKYKDITDN